MREPAIFWWPGTIEPGVVQDMGSTMDLLVTCTKLAGGKVPDDRPIDGVDLTPALLGTGSSPRQTMFFYRGEQLYAVRNGPLKAHFITQPAYGPGKKEAHDPPVLYHLGHDPGEHYNVAGKYPEALAELVKLAEEHKAAMIPGKPQLEAVIGRQ